MNYPIAFCPNTPDGIRWLVFYPGRRIGVWIRGELDHEVAIVVSK